MKIGIFTFHCAINYGAVLQSYCLQEYLKSLGHDVYILNYKPEYLTKPYRNFIHIAQQGETFKQKNKKLIREMLISVIRAKRKSKFHQFIKRRLRLANFQTAQTMNFDLLVFGSDQIWNPKITNGYDKVYFGELPECKSCRKVSYAASIGSVKNIEYPNVFHQLLTSFSRISVREESLKKYINDNFNLDAQVTLDPVLLVDPIVLTNIADRRSIPETAYVLLFTLRNDEQVKAYALKTANAMQLPLVHIVSDAESLFDSSLRQSLSPESLLGYIINASFVISSSFHGIAISIALQKQFYAIKTSPNITERIQQLLLSLGLESRLKNIDECLSNDTINFTTISKALINLRRESEQFIITSTNPDYI